jgi:uroporphyrinogen-III decarboxylase
MTGRERIAKAMRHQKLDRVPVMCQLALGHYFLNAGLPPHRIWFTSESFAEALVRLKWRYRFDGILINIPGRPPNLLDELVLIQATEGGERLMWRNGDITFVPWDDNPHHYPANPSRPERADFVTLDPDHLETSEFWGYTWNIYHVPWLTDKNEIGPLSDIPDYFFRTIDLVKAQVGDEVSIHGEVFSPFTHFMELLGYEQALMSLVTDRVKAHALLDRLTEVSATWAVAQAQHGVDAVLISSAFVGGSFLSLKMYQEFVLPYERRVTEAVKASGVSVYTHTCGKIGDRLEQMAETGTQGIDTLDPPPLGNVDLAEAKHLIGDRLFIKGNMNPVALLSYTTKQEVIAEASRCLRDGAPGGGYILSTACSVAPRVEPWKLELLTPLAEEMADKRLA